MIGCVVVSARGNLYLPDCIKDLVQKLDPIPLEIVDDRDHRLGMAGAVRAAWDIALDAGWDHLLHWEEDFRAVRSVPLAGMVAVLDATPTLAQVVLKRQPWNDDEKRAGGIIEANPTEYRQLRAGRLRWVEHDVIFSLNPCLIPRRVLELGWPDGNEAEFTRTCIDNGYQFAFYGTKTDPPAVNHIGEIRGSGWRL